MERKISFWFASANRAIDIERFLSVNPFASHSGQHESCYELTEARP